MSQSNTPDIWKDSFPQPAVDGHKYDRGHALVLGSDSLTGATRLAAESCSRIGAGLVTVAAITKGDVYRSSLAPDIMVRDRDHDSLRKVDVLLGGCGGVPAELRPLLYENTYNASRVFDAEAIPLQSDWDILDSRCVLTPHEGEFKRVFGEIGENRGQAALEASQKTGAIIILKGAKTIIAAPDGRVVENDHASVYLAKAGTGDVLAGIVTGLIAQGMEPFLASCAAVWIHGDASIQIGRGLIAGDIIDVLPSVIKEI